MARLAPTIALELEREAPTIAGLVAEGERQAEFRRRELRAAEERRQREERERRRAQALQESKAQLLEIAERWALAQRLGAFFAEIERSLSTQDGESRELLEARLAEARALLGGTDALEHFKGWVGPSGRLR